MTLRKQILSQMKEGWNDSHELAEQLGVPVMKVQCALYYLWKKGLVEKESIRRRHTDGITRRANLYKARKANLFRVEDYAEYYRDPIKGGMEIYPKIAS